MKKKLALVLTLAMVFSLAPLSAYANDTITGVGGTASCDVKATYVDGTSGGAGGTVYSVVIDWGDMAFTYTAAAGKWDPATHTTTGADGGVWSVTNTDGNKIKVTNHSNAEITANFSSTAATGYEGITGKFDQTSLTLQSAVNTEVANAPNGSAALSLEGDLDSNTAANTTIGTITVTLG